MTSLFEDYALGRGARELRRGTDLISVKPQVFDLLLFLSRNRTRVVSRDDLIADVWNFKIGALQQNYCRSAGNRRQRRSATADPHRRA